MLLYKKKKQMTTYAELQEIIDTIHGPALRKRLFEIAARLGLEVSRKDSTQRIANYLRGVLYSFERREEGIAAQPEDEEGIINLVLEVEGDPAAKGDISRLSDMFISVHKKPLIRRASLDVISTRYIDSLYSSTNRKTRKSLREDTGQRFFDFVRACAQYQTGSYHVSPNVYVRTVGEIKEEYARIESILHTRLAVKKRVKEVLGPRADIDFDIELLDMKIAEGLPIWFNRELQCFVTYATTRVSGRNVINDLSSGQPTSEHPYTLRKDHISTYEDFTAEIAHIMLREDYEGFEVTYRDSNAYTAEELAEYEEHDEIVFVDSIDELPNKARVCIVNITDIVSYRAQIPTAEGLKAASKCYFKLTTDSVESDLLCSTRTLKHLFANLSDAEMRGFEKLFDKDALKLTRKLRHKRTFASIPFLSGTTFSREEIVDMIEQYFSRTSMLQEFIDAKLKEAKYTYKELCGILKCFSNITIIGAPDLLRTARIDAKCIPLKIEHLLNLDMFEIPSDISNPLNLETHQTVYLSIGHIGVCESDCKMKDGVLLLENGQIYISQTKKSIDTITSLEIANERKHEYEAQTKANTLIVGFDLETVNDHDSGDIATTYSASYWMAPLESFVEARKAKKPATTVVCYNACREALKRIWAESTFVNSKGETERRRIIFITFNGAAFDNILMMHEILTPDVDFDIGDMSVQDVLYTSAGLLSANMNGNKSTFWDLRRHLTTGSLSYLCDSFKIESPKLKLDHWKMQHAFNFYQEMGFTASDPENPFYEWARNTTADEDHIAYGCMREHANMQSILVEYNNRDVECMIDLVIAYRDAVSRVPCIAAVIGELDIFEHKTLSSMHKKAWEKSHRVNASVADASGSSVKYKPIKQKIHIDAPTTQSARRLVTEVETYHLNMGKFTLAQKGYYDDIMRNRIGGRCELFNGPQSIKGVLHSIDACSLYPTNMAVLNNLWYPIGDISEILYNLRDPDLIGWFYCDVDQSTIPQDRAMILPAKINKLNEWARKDAEQLKQLFLSTIEIDFLREYGATVKVDEERTGIQFSHKIKGSDLFHTILELMSVKANQDKLKREKDPSFNPALRETAKILMNSLSGKLNESIHIDSYKIFRCMADIANFQAVHGDVSMVEPFEAGQAIVRYKKDVDKLFKRKQSPVCIGSLIYTYARMYMYRHVISKIPLSEQIYMDTDSGHLRHETFLKWVSDYASKTHVDADPAAIVFDPALKDHLLYNEKSKVFGSFEDELAEMSSKGLVGYDGTYLCKKTYSIRGITKEGEIRSYKNKMKGCSIDRDLWIPQEDVARIGAMTQREREEYYNTHNQFCLGKKYAPLIAELNESRKFFDAISGATSISREDFERAVFLFNIPRSVAKRILMRSQRSEFLADRVLLSAKLIKLMSANIHVSMLCFSFQRISSASVVTGQNVIKARYLIKTLGIRAPLKTS